MGLIEYLNFVEASLNQNKTNSKFLSANPMPSRGGYLMSVHLSCKLAGGAPFPLHIFTLCGVPVTGDLSWSSKLGMVQQHMCKPFSQ